jgi:hypothetical protein
MVTQSVTDTLAVALSDVGSQQESGTATPKSASDVVSIGFDEQGPTTLTLATTDSCETLLDDVVLVEYLLTTSDEYEARWADYTAGASKEDAETYWTGWNGDEHELVYVDSWQMGHRENPDKMRW